MKLVINTCFGGFGLSKKAVARYAELCGKKAYFFKKNLSYASDTGYEPVDIDSEDLLGIFFTFTVPNPNEYLAKTTKKPWNEMTMKEKERHNKAYDKIKVEDKRPKRDDPRLVQVVEELGDEANGIFANLKIVKIPDDIQWEIEENDGNEWVSESHRTWS